MRKLIVAAATAAALGTLGLTATAQAQPANVGRADPTVKETVVAGIPAVFDITKTSTKKCTWKTKGLPGSVTAGNASSVKKGCVERIDGVWPTPGSKTATATVTTNGASTAYTLKVTVKSSPGENDIVGVGSDTTTPAIDALASGYNGTISSTASHEYSWDAVNPVNGQQGDSIAEKADCPAIPRPNGSSAGIAQLAMFTKSTSGPFCSNFARSSRARKTTDPPFAPGGVAFAALAADAISWSIPAVNTSAPASLTQAQLTAIYTCTDTNWDQVGGANQAIVPFIPQNGSGTYAAWLTMIAVTTPGPCVQSANNTLEENEGTNPVLNNPGAIFPFSVGDYIAQTVHSDKCLTTPSCAPSSAGVICKHTPDKNAFFCDIHGTMTEQEINGIAPIAGTGSNETINPAFPTQFDRTLYNVVPYDPATTDHIPGATSPVGGLNLEGIFGATGYDCSSAGAAIITSYGFVPIPTCGSTS